jgi:hypothetical protein
MSMLEVTQTTTDDSVHLIVSGLNQGKSSEQLAQDLGYASSRSLDMHMKRKNYTWYPKRSNYFPTKAKEREVEAAVQHLPQGRVATILSLFKRGIDTKEIVKQLKFEDHREMAMFMRSKGYEWEMSENNYALMAGSNGGNEPVSISSAPKKVSTQEGTPLSPQEMDAYLPLLKLLAANQGKLMNFFGTSTEDEGRIPRYVLPGVYVTKSVHMVYGLDQLVREFSREKNISQREVFEVALVHFFKNYGYAKEINTLIGG